MNCPDCHLPLALSGSENICPQCGGVGFQSGTLAQTLSTQSDIPRLRDVRAEARATQDLCIFCGKDHFFSLPYLPGEACRLRWCPQCLGIFVGEVEWPRLKHLVQREENFETPQGIRAVPDPVDPTQRLDQNRPSEEEFDRSVLGAKRLTLDPFPFMVDALRDQESLSPSHWPSVYKRWWSFLSQAGNALKWMIFAPEIWTFSLLQWASVIMGYYLWVEMFRWGFGEILGGAEGAGPLVGGRMVWGVFWATICFGLVAFPLSLFIGGMTTGHLLRRQNMKVGVLHCVRLTLPRFFSLIRFHFWEFSLSFRSFLSLFPRWKTQSVGWREQRRLWSLGTVGVAPALMTGHRLVGAGKHSANLAVTFPEKVIGLRSGYRWACGVSILVSGGLTLFALNRWETLRESFVAMGLSGMSLWVLVPVMVATAVIKLFLRPLYVVSATELFVEYLQKFNRKPSFPRYSGLLINLLVAFLLLFLLGVGVVVFRQELHYLTVGLGR